MNIDLSLPMPELLVAHNVSKRYHLGSWIIREFSHTFKPGTATGLTGVNGSGKTTMLRMLSTVAFPTSGSITYAGKDIHKHPHSYLKHTGFAFDSSELPQFSNTNELLEAILRSRGKWNAESQSHISSMLEMLKLDERRENLIGTYSSGMMQKTLLAACLIGNPELIILDEPFRALDTDTRTLLIDYLIERKNNGTTIIISSHLPEVIETLCDEVIAFPVTQKS
jgi:ABC-type multidrug transport system ATPase subunit